MKRVLFALVLGLCVIPAGAAFALPTWVGVTPGARAEDRAAEVVSTDLDQTVFTIDVPGVLLERVAGPKGEAFVRVAIPGAGVNNRVGEPSLPVLREMIRVPFGADAEVRVTGAHFRTIDLARQGYPLAVWPQQPPIVKVAGAREHAAFVRDRSAYGAAEYGDELVRIEDEGVIRGMRFVTVAVSPVTYEPARGRLRVATGFTVSVATPASGRAARAFVSRPALADPFFGSMTRSVLLNAREAASGAKALPAVPTGYLVITNGAYAADASLQALVRHRIERGFDVTVATTDATGTTKEAIKSYIQTAYSTWARPPAFILLVGDTDVIPYWTSDTEDYPSTDLDYALLDGSDYIPDAFIGRLSVSSPTDLAHVVDKILSFEDLDLSPYDWLLRATFMASADNFTVSEGTHNYVIANYMDPAGFASTKRYTFSYSATPGQVTSDVNAGLSELTYSGHGDVTFWADGPVYYQSDVQALTNTVYPFVQSYACLTGEFEASECFGETWLRSAHGAVAFMGSSVYSYWDEDDILEKGLYQSYFASPDAVNATWLGGMMNHGKLVLYAYYGGSGYTERYFNEYNLLGDPAIDLWNGTPAAMSPTYPATLDNGSAGMTVETGVPDAVAALSKDGVLTGAARADAAGTAAVTFDRPIAEGGTYTLVVWAHNKIPFTASVTVQGGDDDTGDDDTADDDTTDDDTGDDDSGGDDVSDDDAGDDSAADDDTGGGSRSSSHDSKSACGC